MFYKIKLDQFEGPLDLLLQLIEQQEMDITQVALASVTGQYLEYISRSPDLPTEELADFLVVAAKLLLIKSRILLPELVSEEEGEYDLESQLKIYREYYEASKILHKMILRRRFAFPREKTLVNVERVFSPPRSLTTEKMKELFLAVLREIEPLVSLPQQVIEKTISIQQMIQNIKGLILAGENISFKKILGSARNKTEIIVTFLALLELVKQRHVAVVQENVFEEIVVRKVPPESLPNLP